MSSYINSRLRLTRPVRPQIVRQFQTDAQTKVLLISLKAGGVALNLTVANYIFIMDPWWNPAAEMQVPSLSSPLHTLSSSTVFPSIRPFVRPSQAIDRTHRIGQVRPIVATRFVIADTIEERILRLQEKKKLVFDGTIGGDSAAMARLTVDDMRFLFQ